MTAHANSLLILGMHRSGTSALTRVLNLMGAALPHRLLTPSPENPRGFWESPDIIAANDAILAGLGGRWDDFLDLPQDWREKPGLKQAVAELRALVASETAGRALTVFKDPRICRLVPVWREALTDVGINTLPIIVVRHPLEIAESLQVRNKSLRSKGLLLWLQHFLQAERDTRGMPRIFVSYEDLLARPAAVVDRIGHAFGVDWPVPATQARDDIAAFLSPDLRRQRNRGEEITDDVGVKDWIQTVYDWALQASRDDVRDPAPLGRIHKQLETAIMALRPVLKDAASEANGLAQQIADLQSAEIAAKQRAAALDEKNDLLSGDLVLLKQSLHNEQSKVQAKVQALAAEAENAAALREALALEVSKAAILSEKLLLLERRNGDHGILKSLLRISALQDLKDFWFIARSSEFDVSYYQRQAGGAGMSGWSAIWNYVRQGEKRGLDPNPQFSSAHYLALSPDVVAADRNGFTHWLRHGRAEGRSATISLRDSQPIAADASRERKNGRYQRKTIAASSEIPQSAFGSIDLIIPVYNRPDLVKQLYASLQTHDWAMVRRCIVVDDCSDAVTARYLDGLAQGDDRILLLRNEENLGFLRSCNRASAHVTSDIFVLVNSDIQVGPDWLPRLIAPFVDEQVALATPLATSGANLSVALRDGETWRDVDRELATLSPAYPDACTAIGYCMAVRNTALRGAPLFDQVYRHGYGEDTDLHYRLLKEGWRSVICDNLLVHHIGGASYLLQADASAVLEGNRKIFFDRWGLVHDQAHKRFIERDDLSALLNASRQLAQPASPTQIDVLLVTPGNDRRYGGIRVIFELAEHLAKAGMRGLVYSQTETQPRHIHDHEAVKPVFSRQDVGKMATAIGVVVATGVGTFGEAAALAEDYGARLVLLLQGPEHFFGNGERYSTLSAMCRKAEAIMTVSPYLTALARSFEGRNIDEAALGPDPLLFYPRPLPRKRALAISCSQTIDKGFRFMLPVAQEMAARGWEINFFGDNCDNPMLPQSLGIRHGQLTAQNLAKLFSQCQFYLDMSLFEGLGLLPLESAFCGAVPIMTPKGAPDVIFTDKVNAHFVSGLLDSSGIADLIDGISTEERERLSTAGMHLADIRNADIGYGHLVKSLRAQLS